MGLSAPTGVAERGTGWGAPASEQGLQDVAAVAEGRDRAGSLAMRGQDLPCGSETPNGDRVSEGNFRQWDWASLTESA